MSDELKKIYASQGLSDRYFDDKTPCELWRAQSRQDFKKDVFIMQPHPGYEKRDAEGRVIKQRLPDVKIIERDGKMVVLGCRCTSGDYRGISVFDKAVTWMGPNWINYLIPKGTHLPESLAITKDHFLRMYEATHYTIAPKDDMPLDLFIQTLKIVASKAKLVD
jgi:hypothetical protein